MKRLIFAFALTALFVTSAVARPTPGQESQLSPAEVKAFRDFIQSQKAVQPVAVVKPAPPAAIDPAPVAIPAPVAAPAASTIVVPSPPVAVAASPVTVSSGPGGETTVSIGTIAGQALNWILTIAAVPVSGYVVLILNRFLSNLKIPMTDAARARIKEMVVNGINLAAPAVQKQLDGQGTIAIKNETVAQAVKYVQTHGADTIKKLGLDPTSPAAEEAIRAWIATAIADPMIPTPPVLDPLPAVPQPTPAKV
jgi:hypothetical protein